MSSVPPIWLQPSPPASPPFERRMTTGNELHKTLSAGSPLQRTLSDNTRTFASPLHHHLYESGLLTGGLSDVRVQAFNRIYSLHRLVLAQSDFFRSLLAGGFSEQEQTSVGDLSATAVIPLQFDANCSRSAFEYCLARIYGGGPELLPPLTSKPEPARGYPLTEVFTRQASGERSSSQSDYGDRSPNEVHLATPDFLLSLLATATYLELTAVATAAIQLIQDTVTPYTICTYLRFALGDGLPGIPSDEACTGLAHVSVPATKPDLRQSHPAEGFFYGDAAERVGEACACWLSRWTNEVLAAEEKQPETATPAFRIFSWTALGGLSSEWIRILLSSDSLFLDRDAAAETSGTSELRRYALAKRVVELRRRQKTAWLASEQAPSFLDLQQDMLDDLTDDPESGPEDAKRTMRGGRRHRRARTMSSIHGFVVEDDEAEYERIFSEGIYFTHTPFAQLQALVDDLSPSTGQPYVPSEVLFRAHWDASRLARKLFAPTSEPITPTLSSSPTEGDKARAFLGLMASFHSTPAHGVPPSSARRWVVPVDETIRYNDNAAPTPLNEIDHLLPSPNLQDSAMSTSPPLMAHALSNSGQAGGGGGGKVSRTSIVSWQPETKFYGLANSVVLGDVQKADLGALEGRSWVPFEPYRFSLEFWGIDQLKEKQRLYSQTISYAGSSFNIYLQVLRKGKTRPQLGIYLHRQSPQNPIPVPSHPPLEASTLTSAPTSPPTDPTIELRDHRPSVQVYFAISCPSLNGTSLTRFASGPDGFTLNQSWGWKSSSLKGDEYIAAAAANAAEGESIGPLMRADQRRAARFTSLRASVVMGVV